MVDVNRRVDITELQRLMRDGNADRLLPGNAVKRSTERSSVRSPRSFLWPPDGR
jgi:hypothetical protein